MDDSTHAITSEAAAPVALVGPKGLRSRSLRGMITLLLLAGNPSAAQEWQRTGGPPGGLGYDIRYSFSDPDTWYVTDSFGGVHTSTDNGRSWKPSNSGIPGQSGQASDSRPIFSLTVDPHDPQILWAGTNKTGHIYRSTDGGANWQQRDTGVTIQYDALSFRGFTVSLSSSDVVYAMAETTSNNPNPDTTGGVVYKTINAGENWTILWEGAELSSLARYLWIDPSNENVLYVSTGIFDRGAVGEGDPATAPFGGLGILKSINGGANWTELNESNGLDMLYVGSLYLHPTNPQILLAATGHLVENPLTAAYLESLPSPPNGVYRSSDGGASWTQVITPPPERLVEAFSSVEICPNHPNIAYAGSAHAIYRSADAGATWTKTTTSSSYWGPPGVAALWPIDMQCDPRDPNRVFANNYSGGNFLSADGGVTWKNASQGYTGAQIVGVQVDPSNPVRVWAGGRNGIWRSLAAGHSWHGVRYITNDPSLTALEWGEFGLDPSNPEHLLAGEACAHVVGCAIVESLNGGSSWEVRWTLTPSTVDQVPTGFAKPLVSSFAFAPSDPLTVYASWAEQICVLGHEPCLNGVGVLASSDGGRTWQQTSTTVIGHVGILDLAVDPTDARIVLAAADDGLYRTANGGSSWTKLGGGLPSGRIRTVELDPADRLHVLAGVDGVGVYTSTNGGTGWTSSYAGLEPNGSLHDIVFDPFAPLTVYASDTKSGVYRSTNGGQTWAKLNGGLSNRAVTDLSITADGGHLYAGTDGEGVFRLDLDSIDPYAWIFADDFESGGAGAWSGSAP